MAGSWYALRFHFGNSCFFRASGFVIRVFYFAPPEMEQSFRRLARIFDQQRLFDLGHKQREREWWDAIDLANAHGLLRRALEKADGAIDVDVSVNRIAFSLTHQHVVRLVL